MLKEYVLLVHVKNPTTKIAWWSTRVATAETLKDATGQLEKYYEDNGMKILRVKVKEIIEA